VLDHSHDKGGKKRVEFGLKKHWVFFFFFFFDSNLVILNKTCECIEIRDDQDYHKHIIDYKEQRKLFFICVCVRVRVCVFFFFRNFGINPTFNHGRKDNHYRQTYKGIEI
jgi:hypothetical protein